MAKKFDQTDYRLLIEQSPWGPYGTWAGFVASHKAKLTLKDERLVVRSIFADKATVLHRPSSDGTCSMSEDDDSYFVRFPNVAAAIAAAIMRQRFRNLPKPHSWQGSPCLVVPAADAQPNVSAALRTAMNDGVPTNRGRISAGRTSYYVFRGRFPRGTVSTACQTSRCVQPMHQLVQR